MSNYVTLAWVNAYFSVDVAFLEDWVAFTPAEQQQYIDLAERIIDRNWRYIGKKVNHAQKTEFPRNFDHYIIDTYDLYNPLVKGNNKIPEKLMDAVAEVCRELIKIEDFEQLIALQESVNATNVGVSSISVSMEGKGTKFRQARYLLSPFLWVDYTMRTL